MKKISLIIMMIIIGILWAKDWYLDELIQAGINNAYNLKQKEILLMNTTLDMRISTWNLLPEVMISASHNNNDGRYATKGGLSISKNLTLNDPNYFNYRQNQINHKIAELDVSQAKKELVFSIYSSWLEIIELQKEIAIRQENLKVLNRTKEMTDMQFKLGQRTSTEVSAAEINVINAQLNIKKLENQLAQKRSDLFAMVKLKDDGGTFIEDDNDPSKVPIELTTTDKEPILIQKLKQDMKKLQLNKLQQKIGLYPTLSLSFNYSNQATKNDIFNFNEYEDTYSWSIGISWTLSSLWENTGRYSQIKNSLFLSQWQYENTLDSWENDKANLLRELSYLQETLELNKKKLNQANDNLKIAEERYRLGLMNLINLEEAQVSVLEASLAVNSISNQIKKTVQQWNLLTSQPILGKY